MEIRSSGIAFAKAANGPGIETLDYVECTAAKRLETLKLLVEAHGSERASCNLVLSPDQYSLLQVERPPVEDAELAEAVRWRVKDLIDVSLEDAVLDVFDFPADASRNRGRLINVAVARKPMLRDFIGVLSEAGLVLECIDIADLALRNVARQFEEDQKGAVTLTLRPGGGLLTLTRSDVLYLSRRLDPDLKGLADPDRAELVGQQLALEVQRSLDYYESQLGQPPARHLWLACTDQPERLQRILAENLAIPVAALPISRFLTQAGGPEHELAQCLIAAGAVLREETP